MTETEDALPESSFTGSYLLRTSDQIDKIAAALAKAQGKIASPGKNKTATVPMKAGGTYKYNYADLADVIESMREPFEANGLAMIQPAFTPRPGMVVVVTRLMHESGQYLESDLTLGLADEKPQTLGGAITYGRRYAACGMAGISPDDDNDATSGDAAITRKEAPRAAPAQKKAPIPKAAGSNVGFDPHNPEHALWITKQLKERGVDESLWDDVALTLTGRPSNAFEDVLKTVTAKL